MMKRRSLAWNLVLAVGLAVALPPTGTAQTATENSEARRLFNEGRKFQNDGNLVEAEKKFREALRKYPKAEQSDQTAYYLINTLEKLRRVQDARTEIENFRRNYPRSEWLDDVNESTWELGGLPGAPSESLIWNSPAELREAQARADLLRGARTPAGPPEKIYADEFPPNPSLSALWLRMAIQGDQDEGIEMAKELLKTNPSDPAVQANLGTIANSNSPRAVPFLLSVWANTSAVPNMRNSAFFWFSRRNPKKEEVAKVIMDLLAKKETEEVASRALSLMTVADHRAVLEKIVSSSNSEKFVLMEKIYRKGSEFLRTDLLMFVSLLNDSRSVPFIVQAARQPDSQPSVRRAVAEALKKRHDVDPAIVEELMKAPTPARGIQPLRFAPEVLPPGSAGPGFPSVPSFPTVPVLPAPKK
jgi:tetratricopeptide (TPR) repeat protein